MGWNYRIVKQTYCKGEESEETLYEMREAYYNKDGSIWAITENPVTITSEEGVENIKQVLEWMSLALTKDVIDADTYVFSEPEFSDSNSDSETTSDFEETFSQELDSFVKPD
jgi:hypothetical protein